MLIVDGWNGWNYHGTFTEMLIKVHSPSQINNLISNLQFAGSFLLSDQFIPVRKFQMAFPLTKSLFLPGLVWSTAGRRGGPHRSSLWRTTVCLDCSFLETHQRSHSALCQMSVCWRTFVVFKYGGLLCTYMARNWGKKPCKSSRERYKGLESPTSDYLW